MMRGGNAFPSHRTETDGAGMRHTAVLSYDLQDNRLGRVEYFWHHSNVPQPEEAHLFIEFWVPQGQLKPDSVDFEGIGNNLRISLSAHATWFGMGNQESSVQVSDETFDEMVMAAMDAQARGEGIQEVQPRIIALGDYTVPGVWTPKTAPSPPPAGEEPTPCVLPGNRPYFKPNKVVTRGQACKIICLANNIPTPATTEQTFEDVPVGSTFHVYVEALYGKGAVNGYPCTP